MVTNIVICSFIVAQTAKYVLMTSQNEVDVSKSAQNKEKVPFSHPFFQMLAAYLGEFLFTIFYYIHKAFLMRHEVRQSEIKFRQFIYPALCEFIESMLFIFGLAQLAPSMSMVTKALALPISAFFCRLAFLRILKSFDWR